jgi:parvulin-like peptidyl-prolyl isomerase
MKKKHKKKLFIVILATSVSIFVLLSALVLAIYKFNSENRILATVEKFVPFPAAYIGHAGLISVGEVKEDTNAVKKFYESQDFDQVGLRIDFTTAQGQKRLKIKEKEVIAKLIENKLIENLARAQGITITSSEADDEIEKSSQEFGNQQKLMSELARLYGWTITDFKNKVVIPELYSQKLSEAYSSNVDFSNEVKKINSLHEQVASKKEDFAKVATENSESESAKNGGDLGWSTKDQLISEIADQAFSMKAGDISNVIESPLGFHVIKIEEIKSENGQDLIHLRQIFVKKTTFGDWLTEQMKSAKIFIFLGDYRWNQGSGEIEFKDTGLRDFENNLDINSQGDASVF